MSGLADVLARCAAVTRQVCAVPEPMTVTEWADRYRYLPETSASPGKYDSSVTPYARRWMDLGADPDVSMIVLCWAAQTTKSTVIENIFGYRIHRQPSPMVVVQPKIDAAESWAKERFRPMVLSTPVLRDRVQIGKATESTMRYFRFPGGFTFIASAGSASELASRSSPVTGCDEVDRYETIPGEGNPVEIISARQASSDIGLSILTSTPRDAETTIIWPYLEGGTYEFYHVPCPLCGHAQRLEWSRLRFEDGRPREAWYVCAACDRPFDERHKPAMLAAGAWVPSNPEGAYPSSHLNQLYSPFAKASWVAIKDKFLRAKGKPADLQVFVNTVLAELWEESTEKATDADVLLQRLEPAEEGVVPVGAGALTVGVDVQDKSVHAYAWAWGQGMESWLVASTIIPADTSIEWKDSGLAEALDAWIWQGWRDAAGRPVPVDCVAVDSGHAKSQVYRYTRMRASRRVYAIKGQGGGGYPIVGKPSTQGKERVLLYMVGTDAAKTEFLRSQLATPQPGPGYVHLPDWLTTEQCHELVAERRKRRVHRGRVIYEWRKVAEDAANEALDCRIYARAALEICGARAIANLGAKAAKRAESAPVAAPEPPPRDPMAPIRAVPRRSGGWVTDWKR